MAGSCFEEYKPCMAMVLVQCIYAAMALSAKAVFTQGMNPMVFVVYRQAAATLVVAPITILANGRKPKGKILGVAGFCLVFLASLVGATVNQFLYYQGVHLGSSSMATAMINLVPAITFVMAASVGLERVDIRKLRSMAKILGTVVCVGGAMSMVLFKGPKLLNYSLYGLNTFLQSVNNKWFMGALSVVASDFCWSFWLILQVPLCRSYVDPLSLSAWMCFLSTLQSGVLTLFLLPDLSAWKIHSLFEPLCCIFVGIAGSALTFYLQSWCVSVRGPLYSAMFTPLCTVITTTLAAIILHEELHIGSLVGALAVVAGLYIVLWGKAEDVMGGKTRAQTDDLTRTTPSNSQLDVENAISDPLLAENSPVEK